MSPTATLPDLAKVCQCERPLISEGTCAKCGRPSERDLATALADVTGLDASMNGAGATSRTVPAPAPSASPSRRGSPPDAIGDARAKIVYLTPAKADAMLARNTHNRGRDGARVEQYARDIEADTWVFNGEAIKVARDGTVLDGQHRLLAVVAADTPMYTLVVSGLDPRAQETMDQVRPRAFHDALRLRGEKDPNNLAAAIRAVAMYERDGCPFKLPRRPAISHSAASAALQRHPAIREQLLAAHRRRKPWMPPSQMAALQLIATHAAGAERADAFFDALATERPSSSPIDVLRERLLEAHQSSEGQRVHLYVRIAYVAIAWNAYVTGRLLGPTDLSWRFSDGFPRLEGHRARRAEKPGTVRSREAA